MFLSVLSSFGQNSPENCDAPSQIQITDITETTATIQWQANGQEQQWKIFNSIEEITVTENPYTLTNLMPGVEWIIRPCQNNGLEIYNAVTTKRRYKRLILYDKIKELKMAKNKSFLSSLSNPNKLLNRFAGKMRIEFNLRSIEQIRNYLHISNNNLESVLNATTNPLLEIWDESINETTPANIEVYNKADKIAMLEQCGYDLQAVEMKIRESSPKNTSIKRKMKPYKQLLQTLKADEGKQMNIRELIM